jgi:hypothetical protein
MAHGSPKPPPRGGSSEGDEPAFRPAAPFAQSSAAKTLCGMRGVAGRKAGWSNKLEPPLGGGAGELCIKQCRPKDALSRN